MFVSAAVCSAGRHPDAPQLAGRDRKVALKVLKPELAAVLGAERFVVEIRTTASLQHPHILPLFDSGPGDGFHRDTKPENILLHEGRVMAATGIR